MAQRLSVNVADEVAEAVKDMASDEGTTVTEVIRRSISTEKFLRDAQRRGEKVLIHDPETDTYREIVFR